MEEFYFEINNIFNSLVQKIQKLVKEKILSWEKISVVFFENVSLKIWNKHDSLLLKFSNRFLNFYLHRTVFKYKKNKKL